MTDLASFIIDRVVPGLNMGLWTSVLLIVPSALLGVTLGVTTGVIRVYGPRWAVRIAELYVSMFRGTPLVVQLYFWYFALPYVKVFGTPLVLTPVQASIIGFGLCSAAYQSEYIRGGLLSIRKGQLKASQALGMSPLESILYVVLPQAFRRALPGCGNEIIYLVKYSSLASIITVNELTGQARTIAKQTWMNTEVYATVGVYYLLLVTLATFVLHYIEKRLRIPGFEQSR